jgi:hypothetical protein
MAHTETVHLAEERYSMTSRTRTILFALIGVGLLLTVAGIFQIKGAAHHDHSSALVSAGNAVDAHDTHHAPGWTTRFWANLLLNGWYLLIIALSGTFFIAVNYAANAGWATGLKRIPEAMGFYVPIGLVLLYIAVIFGGHDLYHWQAEGITDPASSHYDAIIASKAWFLNPTFLYVVTPALGIVFFLFHRNFRRLSLREDTEGGLSFFNRSVSFSGAFLFVFAFGFSIMSWMLIMSVDPHWYSTIYAVYNFAVSFVCGIAVMIMFTLFFKSQGYLSFINKEHIHDLGKFMFAFTVFWTYIWLAQYLLIWYADIPEEVKYYHDRLDGYNGIYQFQFWLNLVLCFALPFLGLMTRNAKRNTNWLYFIGTIILIGHWNDMYLLIMPGTVKETAGIGLLELGMPLFFAGLFIFVVLKAFEKAPTFPMKHPYLEESVHHDVGP